MTEQQNGAGSAEAEARAFAGRFGREKGFEGTFKDIAGHACARVADTQADMLAAINAFDLAIGKDDVRRYTA